MGVIRRKQRCKYLLHWYGTWQIDGRREWRRLCRWEGTPPQKGEVRGDALFEASRERAEKMLAEIRGGGEEGLAVIRQAVMRHLERTAGNGGDRLALVAFLADMTAQAARMPREARPLPEETGELPGLDLPPDVEA